MIGGALEPHTLSVIVIGLAVLVAAVRLWRWQRSAPTDARSPRKRMAVLLMLQPVAGVLLFLTLFPPDVTARSGILIVATRGAPLQIDALPSDTRVALPEAADIPGAVRVPDLATALRRFPGVARVRVEGEGLTPRDQLNLSTELEFDPPPPPRGLIDLALPDPVAPGAAFMVGGQVGALQAGTVELVDPADRVVDRSDVVAGGRFTVSADTRTPGLAQFQLRLRDTAGVAVDQVTVPVQVRAQPQARVHVLAGAPDAETKYLRRWAEEAGIALAVDIDVGAGVRLGDPPVALTRAGLREVDLLVIDDRRWQAVGAAGRAALRYAVAEGMGLILRPSGPLSPQTRRDWAGLGLPLTGGDDVVPFRLDARGGDADPADPASTAPEPPELARRDLVDPGSSAVSILRDSGGSALASWRSLGRGRVGLWTVADSYALILTGRGDRYSELWSDLFSALARPGDEGRLRINSPARSGTRVSVCRLPGRASVFTPAGARRTLLLDPASGDQNCAAFWPDQVGWHLVRDEEGRETPFYVHSPGSMRSLEAWSHRQETLARVTPAAGDSVQGAPREGPGSPWPWFAALICVLGLLWATERHRPMRSGPPGR